jgi:Domain of unknown function (DUF929)
LVVLFALPVSVAEAAHRTDGSTPAPAAIARLVTNVPASTLNKVGAGSILPSQAFGVFNLKGQLTKDGKPEVLSMNLAWCPHCAANSWALAVALSRFGRLTGLRVINTGTYYCKIASNSCTLQPFLCYPYTHGLSLFGTRYQSSYLSFGEIVLQDVQGHNLQKPTRSEGRAIGSFDQQGETPALDVGGAYGFLNAGYDPGSLAHKTWSQIAGSLAKPHDPLSRHIDGLANLFTAAFCKVTKGRPVDVCASKGVLAAGARLRTAPGPPPPGPPPGGPPA